MRADESRRGKEARGILALALAVLAGHVIVNVVTPYELHRDEFLYLAMGDHLRLFAMDFPPFIAIAAKVSRALLGDSAAAIRILPALAHAALVWLAARIAWRLGGGRFAQWLAALAIATVPLYVRPGAMFQPVVFDQLWWTLALYALLRIAQAEASRSDGGRDIRRAWIRFGVAAGLGLLTKFTALLFGACALIAVLLTPLRRHLRTPAPWIAAAIAFAIGAPSLLGQITLHFPVLAQMGDLRETQLERVGYLDFLSGQILNAGPFTLLAIAGLVHLVRARGGELRAVAWMCVLILFALMLLHGKPYYAGPVYPTLFAAGAVSFGNALQGFARRWGARGASALRAATLLVVVALGIAVLPMGVPILAPARMAEYARALGVTSAVTTNRGEVLPLPQDYADMTGWRAQSAAVARAYQNLPAAERARTAILAANYGEAGALDFYGRAYGLPRVVSPAGTYWFFGPGPLPGEVAIVIGADTAELRTLYRDVQLVEQVNEPWAVPEERGAQVSVVRGPYRSLQSLWPSLAGRN